MNRIKTAQPGYCIILLLALALLMAGCGAAVETEPSAPAAAAEQPDAAAAPAVTAEMAEEMYIAASQELAIDIEQEFVPLDNAPALPTLLMPTASGLSVSANSKATIDYSNTSDGYVMVKFATASAKKLKVLIKGPSGVTYTYNLNGNGAYDTYPLSDGSGSYSVGVYENISGTSYATAHTANISVSLKDEFAPFLLPNQYVNYAADSQVVVKAAELTAGKATALEKVTAVYNYVITNISYDYDKANSVTSGYLPVVDQVLAAKKGICFDYAAVMAAMLRSQSIPTKLVVGYSGSAYHAWINIYSAETGWINGVIFFDGVQWKLLDPTYAANANQSAAIMEYIGNNANYTAKYLY